MKQIPKIKTLLVGLGRIAHGLEKDPYRIKPCTHAGVLYSNWGKRYFTLDGICDSDTSKVETFFSEWKPKPIPENIKLPKSISKISNLRFPFDFAIIATPSDSHFEIACQLLNSGIPNLLIEKPVCLSAKDAIFLNQLAKSKGAKVWVNHERRYHPRYIYIRNKLKSNAWGNVKLVRANVLTSAKNPGLAFSKMGGGPLLHDGTHAIDLLFWMFGKLNLRYANVERPGKKYFEDRASVWLGARDGLEVFLDVSGGRDYFQFEIDIFTEKNRIILSNDGFQLFESKPSTLYKGFKSLKQGSFEKIPKIEKSNAFLGIYQEIHQNISKKINSQEGSLEDNIDILQCIESIYKFRRKK
ncbi:MAG: Gfo/Idh/MocA family oxidoreductase [Leptospira sp.]|nr:Gfo/Idh/MocA family oxidoreductase [Leptospira sp.]